MSSVKRFPPIPKDKRKKILLLSDDIRQHSGIATMAREIVVGTSHHFNWVNLGGGVNHPDVGLCIDISQEVNKYAGISDAETRIIPTEGYGTQAIVRQLLHTEKPDAIMIFTDPRYWIWLFEMEREIRTKIPIIYYNIWDNFPAPMYNKPYYDSVDGLLAISKQTKLINEIVLQDSAKNKVIKYVPHGINDKYFFPFEKNSELYKKAQTLKTQISQGKDIDFVVLFNSRNIRRKSPGDVILAYRLFCDSIGKEQAKRCALVLHTEVVFEQGTDLKAVSEAICDREYCNVSFSQGGIDMHSMNILYNMADVTVLVSSNEGWGLSVTESMMAGTMVVANVTGGIQDQLRFENSKGEWYTPSLEIPSNHRGTFKEHGKWAEPVFPSSLNIIGSPPTPYLFEDRCSPEDIAAAIKRVWELSPEERRRRGLLGREWAMSDEAKMTATHMADGVIEGIEEVFENFKPRTTYDLLKVQDRKQTLVPHTLVNY